MPSGLQEDVRKKSLHGLHGRREPRQRKEATSVGTAVHNDENGGVPLGGEKVS